MKPQIEILESRTLLSGVFEGVALYAVGSGPLAAGTLTFFNYANQGTIPWQPFGSGYTGGFRVAMADINGDGYNDLIAGTGPGVQATVLVYDGHSLLNTSYLPYTNQNPNEDLIAEFHPFGNFTGGVFVTGWCGYSNHYLQSGKIPSPPQGNYNSEIIVSADAGGGPLVGAFDQRGNAISQFFAYEANYSGGVRVAVGDFDNDLRPDIACVPGTNHIPSVNIFYGNGRLQSFDAFGGLFPAYTSGVTIDVGSLDSVTDSIVVGMQKQASMVATWTNVAAAPTPQFLLASPFAVGVHVGLSYTRTGPYTVEPTLLVAFDNTPVYFKYKVGETNSFGYGYIPPGIFTNIPRSTTLNDPLQFVPAEGGWIS